MLSTLTGVSVQSVKMLAGLVASPRRFHIALDRNQAYLLNQGRRHEVSTGGGDRFRLGGQIQVSQNHLPPNSDFSSDFAHFILEIPENPNFSVNIQKIFFKNCDFWGGHPPRILNRGDMYPPSPPVATPMF